jgi:hypothetical protein
MQLGQNYANFEFSETATKTGMVMVFGEITVRISSCEYHRIASLFILCCVNSFLYLKAFSSFFGKRKDGSTNEGCMTVDTFIPRLSAVASMLIYSNICRPAANWTTKKSSVMLSRTLATV